MSRFRSIIARLVALHVVAIAATAILMPLALYWLLYHAANNLMRDALRGHAETLATFLHAEPDGSPSFALPAELQALYGGGYGRYLYAVVDDDGRVLFSSRRDGQALFPGGDPDPASWLLRRRAFGGVLFGVTLPRSLAGRRYWIQVGQDLSHRDVVIDDIVGSFLPRVAWITLPILLLLLVIDILIFRRALAPVRAASDTAAAIGPARTDVRLPERPMPAEILPLVHAVNQAFDRLEAGFRAQRDFTADMAHELRTPLAIMRARVDGLPSGATRDALRADLAKMTHTLSQVLDIAELESLVIGEEARADLHAVCAEAVAFMAPLALESARAIALLGVERPVWVHGHAEALFRAIRNLIENALRHSPRDSTVEVELSADGAVRVLDQGPGVAESERQSIFRRFWRRDRSRPDSRGLGLAIVARVAETHGGTVAVANRPGGGAAFTLRLRPAADPPAAPDVAGVPPRLTAVN